MAETLLLNQPFMNVGLQSMTSTIAAAGLYNVHCELTEVPPSGLTVTVSQNSTPVYMSPALSPTQIAQQFKTELSCAANDVITVVLSSSTPVDALLNSVKSTTTLGQGL